MRQVLHLTPHLGGGVGKALSSLVATAARCASPFRHAIVCLERPEKTQFINRLAQVGCDVVICPEDAALLGRLEKADIVQIEFWNHPTLPALLCREDLPPMRLLAWCHISGLFYPRFPPGLPEVFDQLVFTSACSYQGEEVRHWRAMGQAKKLGVVSSGGGMEDLPLPVRPVSNRPLTAGYLGSLNYSKLHPDFVTFLSAVADPDFSVRVIGDETNRSDLERQCRCHGRDGLLIFRGYCSDIASELSALDVLIYLLNPAHYGTAENALLEAMAMGVVPIVLENSAECDIVEDGESGIVIRTPGDLARAMDWLQRNPEERQRLSCQASLRVRERFRSEAMVERWASHYVRMMDGEKTVKSSRRIFGVSPADWFRSFVRDPQIFHDDGAVSPPKGFERFSLFERTKGSVEHFSSNFPNDSLLASWTRNLAALGAEAK